jgi:hypothetical protein
LVFSLRFGEIVLAVVFQVAQLPISKLQLVNSNNWEN